ncbi:MAG: site-specific integrase [Acidimicrobiales bacterium]
MKPLGAGTVSYDKSRRKYFAKVPVGRTLDGRTLFKKRQADNRRQANEYRRQMLDERDRPSTAVSTAVTFSEFAEEHFLYEARNELRETTISGYLYALRKYVYPEYGKRTVSSITSAELSKFFAILKRDYSASLVNQCRSVMSRVFEAGINHRLLDSNPIRRTKKARPQSGDRRLVQPHWTLAECREALRASSGTEMALFFHIAIFLGMRHGELLGLQWSDFDFEARTVTVQRTLSEPRGRMTLPDGNTKPYFSPPKTLRGRRTLKISWSLIEAALIHRSAQEQLKTEAGTLWQPSDCVFTTRVGTPIYPSNHSKYFRRFLSDHGLRHIRVHDLRHSAATNALELGVGLPEISRMLGHTNLNTTFSTYASEVKGLEDRATSALASYFENDDDGATDHD